jgi:CBS domain-containing protein
MPPEYLTANSFSGYTDVAARPRYQDARMVSPLPDHRLRETPVPFADASVEDAMSHGVIHCAPETPLRTVARMMATHNVHAIYVFDYGDEADVNVELWGIVSDLDVAAAACGELDGRTARGAAVTPLQTVKSDQPLSDAAELMSLKGLTHLAVIDPASRRPVGVVSTLDVARAVAAGQGVREVQPSA